MKDQYRQGDLLFEVVSSIPTDAKKVESPVLALGETTGHAHRIEGSVFERYDTLDAVYFKLYNDGQVVHDEHGSIPIKKNLIMKQTRQRQYDPVLSIPVPVVD